MKDLSSSGNRKLLVIIILIIIDITIFDLHVFFKNSTRIVKGYENSESPLEVYVFGLSMYLIYLSFSLIILQFIRKKDLLLSLLALLNCTIWIERLISFFLWNQPLYVIIKDYFLLTLLVPVLGIKYFIWKKHKSKPEKTIQITNLAVSKWRIPKNDVEEAIEQNEKNLALEHKVLRNQLNPHFLFNSLTSIQSYIYNESTEKAAQYIGDFAQLMQMIIEYSREEYIAFTREQEILNLYLQLQQLRFSERFEYNISIDQLIDVDKICIPPMFAQPFIENALEHGILHKREKGKIDIRFILKDEGILFEVEDNGVGREKAAEINQLLRPDHKSFASKITEERLVILYKVENPEGLVKIEDLSDKDKEIFGTRVSFIIPYTSLV